MRCLLQFELHRVCAPRCVIGVPLCFVGMLGHRFSPPNQRVVIVIKQTVICCVAINEPCDGSISTNLTPYQSSVTAISTSLLDAMLIFVDYDAIKPQPELPYDKSHIHVVD